MQAHGPLEFFRTTKTVSSVPPSRATSPVLDTSNTPSTQTATGILTFAFKDFVQTGADDMQVDQVEDSKSDFVISTPSPRLELGNL